MPEAPIQLEIQRVRIDRRLEVVRSTIFAEVRPIEGWAAVEAGAGQPAGGPPPARGFKPFKVGAQWGGLDVSAWFAAKAALPREWKGRRVEAILDLGAEGLLYLGGKPAQGLDGNHQEVLLADPATGRERFPLLIEAYSSPRDEAKRTFARADLAVVNTEVREFYYDARVAWEVACQLPPDSAHRVRLFDAIEACVLAVDVDHLNQPRYFTSLRKAAREMKRILREFSGSRGMGGLVLCGHSHIDTAWLWPLRETRRKCGRTFATMLAEMEQFPEFCFMQSQPQLYDFVKRDYPELYRRMKQRIADGRWDVIGGSWVEADCNVTSGESLVRQFLYGKRFLRREFGRDTRVFWQPDTFGYAYSLPQILKKAGMDYFVTTKIRWSQYNQLPHDVFWWEGLDGTRVLAHQPCGGYNGNPIPDQLVKTWDRFRDKNISDEVLYPFGHGDGGGGPDLRQLNFVRRLSDFVGMPRTRYGRVEEYYARREAEDRVAPFAVWSDELYLELHRGCQTSQARTKRGNRKCELLLRDAEMLSCAALPLGLPYPQDRLYQNWTLLLCNQFHDILPGSSIRMVYEEAEREYARILADVQAVRDAALARLAQAIDTRGDETPVLVFNTLSWPRTDIATVRVRSTRRDLHVLDDEGNEVPSQIVGREGGQVELIFEARDIPALGWCTHRVVPGKSRARNPLQISARRLENDFFRIELDATGAFTRVHDKRAGREVLAPGGRGNELLLFEDRPNGADAWDIEEGYEKTQRSLEGVESIEVVERGPVRAALRVVRKTERSRLEQDIIIYASLPRVDFVTRADWHERRTLLKAAFAVDVLSPRATYEIQFGAIERPTTRNTSWEVAKLEVAGQKWADLSEHGYGVSILNDCKYGWDIRRNVMRLSLLRSPISPDPEADQGEHHFTYSLYPHAGDWREGTVRAGYELNCPLITRVEKPHAGSLPPCFATVAVEPESVIVDTIKKAEDSGDFIVRVYEAHGSRGPARLSIAGGFRKAVECNLMEEEDTPVETDGDTLRFPIKPWEIKTFKITV